jgi:tetratricopeptide (TPR) repeat protein
MGAKLMVLGSYQIEGENVHVQARFVEVETGQVDRELRYEVHGKRKDLYGLQQQLASAFAEQFARSASEKEKLALQSQQALTQNPEAQGAFLQAQEILTNTPLQALALYEKAARLDSNYLLPYTSIAEIWASEVIFKKKYDFDWLLQDQPQQASVSLETALQKSAQALQEAQRINPDHISTHSAEIYLAYAQGKKAEALNHIKHIPVTPHNTAKLFELFTSIYFDFEAPQSVEAFREVDTWAQQLLAQSQGTDVEKQLSLLRINLALQYPLPLSEFGKMEAEIQTFLTATPRALDLQLMLLALQLKQGKTDAVKKTFAQVRALSQSNALSKLTLANIALEQKDFALAISLCEEAIALGFKQPIIYLVASTAEVRQGHPERAIPPLQKLAQDNPYNMDAIALLSTLEKSPQVAQRLEQNLVYAQQRKTPFPNPAYTPLGIRKMLAQQYKALGQWEKAESALMTALNTTGMSANQKAEIYQSLSELYYVEPFEKHSQTRAKYLQAALKLQEDPRQKVSLYKQLADEYSIYQQRIDLAQAQLENALLLATPQEVQSIKLDLARLLESQEKYTEAQQMVEALLAQKEPEAKAFYVYGTLLAAQEHYSQAAQAIAQYMERDTWAAQQSFYQNLYKSYVIEARVQEEIRSQQKPRLQTLNDLAVSYIGMKDWDAAIILLQGILEKAPAQAPEKATLYYNLGTAYLAQSQWALAQQALTEAVRYQENYPAAWYNLAVAHLNANQKAEARQALLKLKLLQPDYPGAAELIQLLR